MSKLSPLNFLSPSSWADSLENGENVSPLSGGGAFLQLFQGMLGGGMPSWSGGESTPGLGGFGMDSFLTPVLFDLYSELLESDAGQSVPQGWKKFPAVEENAYGYGVRKTKKEEKKPLAPPDIPGGDPVQGRISQGVKSGHRAIDYAVTVGTPIKATLKGEVVKIGKDPYGYGNYLVLENGPFQVYFAHLSEINVEEGETIWPGQVIGLSGNTGNSTGPHLHYEIRKNGKTIDPRASLKYRDR